MKALVTGASGQDSSYLIELLLEKGYEVVGVIRRSSTPNTSRIDHIKHKIKLVEGDITDYSFLFNLITSHRFNEIYNLAAQSHVGTSFENASYTTNVNYLGCLNILEVLRWLGQYSPRFYQASTSEIMGSSLGILYGSPMNSDLKNGNAHYRQDENTPFKPESPYAIAKLAAHHAVGLYRKAYGIHASAGILFNHESERRGDNFVTKKITNYIRKLMNHANFDSGYIKDGIPLWIKMDKLKLGNLSAQRDWGYAKEYVEGMWMMLQQDKPDDYVLATGETHTVEDFLAEAFGYYSLDWHKFVEVDESLVRPSEVPYLCGNAKKAKDVLGWEAHTKFKGLVKIMVENS